VIPQKIKNIPFLPLMEVPINKLRGNLLVLAAATLWGTTGTSQALAPVGATPPVIGALRLLVGGLALLAYALIRRSFQGNALRGLPRRSLLGAVVCMAAYQLLFFGGVARTGVAVGTIVGIGSSPILGGVLGYLFAGERPGRPWGIATLLAVIGVGLLAANGSEIRIDLLGLLMAAGAGGAYAAFTLFNKQLLNGRRPEAIQALIFLLSALLLSPLLLGVNLSWVAQPSGVMVVLHLGLVTLALAYTLFSLGLQQVGVSTAVTLTLAEPMTAAILGVTLLGETLTLQAGLGIVLIFGGLAFLSFRAGPKPQK
jgi:DME family drug/metabolite transporter